MTKKNMQDCEIKKIFDDFTDSAIEIFKESLSLDEDHANSLTFLSFFIIYCEKMLGNLVISVLRKGVSSEKNIFSELSNEMLEEVILVMNFNQKISIYEKIVGKYECYKDLKKGVSFFRQINEIRNKVFHCDLGDIKYKGKSLKKGEIRHLMIGDFFKAIGQEIKKEKIKVSGVEAGP